MLVVSFSFVVRALSDKLRQPHACPDRDQTKRDAAHGVDCPAAIRHRAAREGLERKAGEGRVTAEHTG